MLADLILHNGNFITMSDKTEPVVSIAISNGKIIGTGFENMANNFKSSNIIDLQGKTVLPGFIDTHTHFLQTGLNLNAALLIECRSISEIQDCLCEAKLKVQPGNWLHAHGVDENNLKEKRLPIREELDAVSHDIPIFISRIDHHSCILNSKAVGMLDIYKNIKGADFKTGFFRGAGNYFIRTKLHDTISNEEKYFALNTVSKLAISKGLTTIHVLEGGNLFGKDDVRIIQELENKLPLSLVIYHQTTDINVVENEKLPRIGGCLLVDGSIGSRTAAFKEPYIDDLENSGFLYFKDEALFSFVEKAHEKGMQISLHAIGDKAIAQVVRAYERAQKKYPRYDARHRIEHAELPTPELIEKIAKLGITIGVQPTFETFWGGQYKMYAARLGKERANSTNPFRSYCNNGILLAGGSDSDVTPMDPLLGISSAINHPNTEQRLTVKEALALYTTNAAKIAFQENDRGSIDIGKRADLVVLNENPFETMPEQIPNIIIVTTIINGQIVYAKKTE